MHFPLSSPENLIEVHSMAGANKPSTLTRYKSPLPPDVIISRTKLGFSNLQTAHLPALVHPENGGYYLKTPEGKVIAVADDRLCCIADKRYMSLIHNLECQGLHEEANENMEDLRKAGIDADQLKAETTDEFNTKGYVHDGDPDEEANDYTTFQQPPAIAEAGSQSVTG